MLFDKIKTRLQISIILIIIVFSCVIETWGQTQQIKVRIKSIVIEGSVSASEELVRINTGLTVGSLISGEDVQRAIRQLHNLGIYSHISVWKTDEDETEVDILIKVLEYPRLKEIEIEGNKEVKLKDVEEKLSLYPGQVLNQVVIRKAMERLKKRYIEKGFLLVDIKPEVSETSDTLRQILTVKINEGLRVQVKKIRFHGNENYHDKTLRKQMEETKEDTWWRGADFKPEEFEKDKEKILGFYRNNGYRNAKIIKDSISYGPKNANMFIDVFLEEGRRYYFGSTSFEGNQLFTADQLSLGFKFDKGDVYNEEKFGETIQNINKFYYDDGYIYAQVSPRETIANTDTVNIHFSVVEGEPVHVNQILISGNTKTKEKVIRREIWLKPGERFSNAALERSQRDVWILNYFANVEPSLRVLPNDPNLVDIVFQVEEKSTDTANMSAGYSQMDGMIGAIGVTMNNFRGSGQMANFEWQFGRIYRSLRVGFTEPWLFNTPTLAGFSVFDTKRGGRWYGFDYRNRGASLRLGRRFRWPDDFFRGDWIFRVARNEVSNLDPGLDIESRLIGNRNSSGISLTQMISRDSRNRPEFPTAGSVFQISNTISGGPLGGNEEFHQHEIIIENYMPVFWKFILFHNVNLGYMDRLTRDSYIPPLDLFYMGGTALSIGTQLRGYEERGVGSLTSSGFPMGGLTKVKVCAEFRFPIIPNPTTYGLVFVEAGNIWEDASSTNPFDLRRSAGVGFRIFMPMVGMLGLDIGYGFDNIEPITFRRYGKWRAHFQFGRQF